ncbi:putative transposase [Azomonas agilis]|uniref:Putative transposase n=1 Tax=Azomonas agilis TaxID=116849 RepID=A0A562HZG3_9GAMM|nr:putative transposase [Azomonas agilis]
MKKSRFTDSQIIAVLKQAEEGTPVPKLCREHTMSSATFYKLGYWQNQGVGFAYSSFVRYSLPQIRDRHNTRPEFPPEERVGLRRRASMPTAGSAGCNHRIR